MLLKTRADLLKNIRDFFATRQILEVETPYFCQTPPANPGIAAFTVQGSEQQYYLHTSPESHMKALIARHPQQALYQICRVFRDDPQTAYHLPEFTMIEWYRPAVSLQTLITEVIDLIQVCINDISFETLSYQDLFLHYLSCDPLDEAINFYQIAQQNDINIDDTATMDTDDWCDLLFSHCIQPQLMGSAIVITDFPRSQAELAEVNPHNPKTAERFEILIDGIEMANGYHELRDPAIYLERLAIDNQKRQRKNLEHVETDPILLDAMTQGLPNCCGVAVGFDRLLMLKTETENIQKIWPGHQR